MEQQNAPYLNNIDFHEGELKHFRKLKDGTIYDSSDKLIFVPINLEHLKIDKKCESFKTNVLNGMMKLTTIEFMSEKYISARYSINYNSYSNVKNISFCGAHVSFDCIFKSLENL